MPGVALADYAHDAAALNDLAVHATLLDGWLNFHALSLTQSDCHFKGQIG